MSAPVKLEDVRPEHVEWLWQSRIPRSMITVIAGRPEQGKGLFAAHVAAEVSKTKFATPNGGSRYGNVLYVAMEDGYGLMTGPRLRAAGARMRGNVHLWRFQIPEQLDELWGYVVKHSIDLIVVDPFAAVLGRGVGRRSDSVRRVLNPITEMLEQTGCAMLVVEHALKRISPNAHPLDVIGGSSSGLPAAARMGYFLGKDPRDPESRILAAVKSNLRATPDACRFSIDEAEVTWKDPVTKETEVYDAPYLMFEGEEKFDVRALFESGATGDAKGPGRPADKRAAASEWLANYLFAAGTAVKSSVIREDAKQAGMTEKTLRRAADDMNVLRNPPGGGRNCQWSLPDEVIEAMKDDDDEPEESTDMPVKKGEEPEETDDGMLSDDDIAKLLGGTEDEDA